MSFGDGLAWVLIAAGFALGVVSTLVVQRLGRAQSGGRAEAGASRSGAEVELADEHNAAATGPTGPPDRVRPAPLDAAVVGGGVQALVLTATADRLPAGCKALVLCPPGERASGVWHIHLAGGAALAVPDGRTIPLTPPESTHEWSLPSGRRVRLAVGGAERRLSHDAVTVQVNGPYVKVTTEADASGQTRLTATVFGHAHGPSELRANLSDGSAVEAALRQAFDLAAGSRLNGQPIVLSYSPTAWNAHRRFWVSAVSA